MLLSLVEDAACGCSNALIGGELLMRRTATAAMTLAVRAQRYRLNGDT